MGWNPDSPKPSPEQLLNLWRKEYDEALAGGNAARIRRARKFLLRALKRLP